MKTSDYLNHSNYISNCINVVELYFFPCPIFCNVFIFFLECFNCISFDSVVLVLGIHPKATTKNVYKKALQGGSLLGIYNIKYWGYLGGSVS